jgi:hypothetical protein
MTSLRTAAACHRSIATDGLSDFPILHRVWNDPAYRQAMQNRAAMHTRHANVEIDATLLRTGTRWPAHWTAEEKADATRQLLENRK